MSARGQVSLEKGVPWRIYCPRNVRRQRNIDDATTIDIELEAKFRLDWLFTCTPGVGMRSNLSVYTRCVNSMPGLDYRLRGVPLTLGANLSRDPAYTTRLGLDQTTASIKKDFHATYCLDSSTSYLSVDCYSWLGDGPRRAAIRVPAPFNPACGGAHQWISTKIGLERCLRRCGIAAKMLWRWHLQRSGNLLCRRYWCVQIGLWSRMLVHRDDKNRGRNYFGVFSLSELGLPGDQMPADR